MRYAMMSLINYNRVTFASVRNQEGVKILFKTFAPDIYKFTISGAATVRIANTDQHAVQLDIPLQFEILRERRGHVRRSQLETLCHAGIEHKTLFILLYYK